MPLIAAVPKMFLPFLVILPGLIAVSVGAKVVGPGVGGSTYATVSATGQPLPLDGRIRMGLCR